MSDCTAELKAASQREKSLLHELSTCRTEMQSMEASFQHHHRSEMTRLRTTLVEEGEAYKNETLDDLVLQFKTVLSNSEQAMHENFSIEISEMSAQNDSCRMNRPLPKDLSERRVKLGVALKVPMPLLGSRPHHQSQRLSLRQPSRIRLRFLRVCAICSQNTK